MRNLKKLINAINAARKTNRPTALPERHLSHTKTCSAYLQWFSSETQKNQGNQLSEVHLENDH